MIDWSEIKGINLLEGDCMEFMATMPDGCFKLCITDPPYGVNISRHKELGYKGFNKYTPKMWDNEPPKDIFFIELFRISENQIVWGMNYFNLPTTRGFIVWDKGNGFSGRTYAECELAWTSFDCNARIFRRDPLAKGDYHNKIHINQKPVALYEWLLTNYAKLGDKILDSHAGSFSSAIACHNLGFDYVGIEKDADYFEAGKKRVEMHQRQGRLF